MLNHEYKLNYNHNNYNYIHNHNVRLAWCRWWWWRCCCWALELVVLLNLASSQQQQQQHGAPLSMSPLWPGGVVGLQTGSGGESPLPPIHVNRSTWLARLEQYHRQQQQPQLGVSSIELLPLIALNRSQSSADSSSSSNRWTNVTKRTAAADYYDQQLQDTFRFSLANSCERDHMLISLRTSRPFYGLIHTKNQRHKSVCSIEGNGELEFNLNLSLALDPADANFCGVFRTRRNEQLVSVILAIRFNRNIELSNDKYYLLNCTNNKLARLETEGADRPGGIVSYDEMANMNDGQQADDASRRLHWLLALLACLGLLLLVSIVLNCLLYRSFRAARDQLELAASRRRRRQSRTMSSPELDDVTVEGRLPGMVTGAGDHQTEARRASQSKRSRGRHRKNDLDDLDADADNRNIINYDNTEIYQTTAATAAGDHRNSRRYAPFGQLERAHYRLYEQNRAAAATAADRSPTRTKLTNANKQTKLQR